MELCNCGAVKFEQTVSTATTDRQVKPTFYNHRWKVPVVYVFDETGHAEWKVSEAVKEWNASKANLNVQMTTDKAQAHIIVREGDASGYAGLTSYNTIDGGYTIIGADIQCAPVFRTYPLVNETIVIHELGHAFGIYHNTGYKRASAMNASVGGNTAVSKPSSWDLANLDTIY